MGRIKPDCPIGKGVGAWEVAARWSYIDLNDEDITGNRLEDLTFGLNCYLHANMKLQLNYINANLSNRTFGDSDTDIYATRCQIDF